MSDALRRQERRSEDQQSKTPEDDTRLTTVKELRRSMRFRSGLSGSGSLEAVLHWDPSILHQLHGLVRSLGQLALHVADLAKDRAVEKLSNLGMGATVPIPPVQVSGSGRVSARATVLAYPPPGEILDHLRVLRYALDPTFSRGKHHAEASRLVKELLQTQTYLSAKHTGEMAVRMDDYRAKVAGESPASLRQRVPRILRRRTRRRAKAT